MDLFINSYLIEGVDIDVEMRKAYRRLTHAFPRPTRIHHHEPTRSCTGEFHTTISATGGVNRGRFDATGSPAFS